MIRFFFSVLGRRVLLLPALTLLASLLDSFGVLLAIGVVGSLFFEGTIGSTSLPEGVRGWVSATTPALVVASVCAILVVKAVAKWFAQVVQGSLNARLTTMLTERVLEHLTHLPFSEVARQNTGQLASLLTNDINRVSATFLGLSGVVTSATFATVALCFAAAVHFEVTVATLGFGLLMFGCSRVINRKLHRESVKITAWFASLYQQMIEYLQAYKYLRGTGKESAVRSELSKVLGGLEENSKNLGRIQALSSVFAEPLVFVFLIGVLAWLAESTYAAGSAIAVVVYFYRVVGQMTELQVSYHRMSSSAGSYDRVRAFFERAPNVFSPAPSGARALPNDDIVISFDQVNFSHDRLRPLFRGLNLEIKRNAFIAVVGESGAGKTTLVDLILGLYRPESGTVDVSVQGPVAYLSQDFPIFETSVRNNLTLWQACPNEDELWRALRLACLDGFIRALPGGLDAKVGDRGTALSGGQRQRLAIARELYKRPDLLILDEATSALDAETEALFQQTLVGLKGSCTLVLIAHRLVSVRAADQVIVLDGGHIVEQGTFQDLRSREFGVFRQLAVQQGI